MTRPHRARISLLLACIAAFYLQPPSFAQELVVNGGSIVENNGGAESFQLGSIGFSPSGPINPTDSGTYRITGGGTTTFNRATPNDSDTGNVFIGQVGGGAGQVAITNGSLVAASQTSIDNGTINIHADSGQAADLATGRAILAFSSGSQATVNVTGPGSTLNVGNGSSHVGYGGTATLDITGGGVVYSQGGAFGRMAGSSGTVNVSGAGSKLIDSGNIIIGLLGTGALNITDGGLVQQTFESVMVGSGLTGGSGSIKVSGTNSRLEVKRLDIGENNSGTLEVTNGGKVVSQSDLIVGVGFINNANPNGNVIVSGANSTMEFARTLVGLAGQGSLTIESGASVIGGEIGVGVEAAGGLQPGSKQGVGNITVTGNGSLLTGTSLYLGGYSNPVLGSTSGGVGTLNVLDGGAVVISGDGALFAGGTVTVDGGTFSVSGTLNNDGGAILFNSGVIGGNGHLNFNVEVGNEMTIAPGNSIGTLGFSELTLSSGGAYEWEVADLSGSGAPGTGWDLVNVSGMLTLDATVASPFTLAIVDPSNVTGFTPSQAGSWVVAQFGSLGGTFDPNAIQFDTSGFSADLEGGHFVASISGNSLFANFVPTAVPEPSTFLLLTLAGAGFYAKRGRRLFGDS